MSSLPLAEAPRRFLFLQGPITPFFARVAQGLAARGHAVRRINFNLGDRLIWPRAAGPFEDYRGRPEAWPAFIADRLDRHAITDVVLLGEQRRHHRAAIAAAQARGIAVTVTDFGYFRPDWITLERDGMGGDGRFPRDPAAIRALAQGLPPADLSRRFTDSFPRQAARDVTYHVAAMLPGRFRHYRSHHLHHPFRTYWGIGLRLLRRGAERAEGARAIAACAGHPFWLFAMQMETDFSIRAYSPYPDMTTPLREAIGSFARHAPAEGRLIVKVHPLDPCIRPWGRIVPRIAAEAGVAARVHVAHDGKADDMLIAARGMITVNSTLGLRAIVLRAPVKALGQAVWDVPGLAHQGPLDRFWAGGAPPDPALRLDFLAALQAFTQVRGVYYAPEGLAHAVAETVERLATGRVGVPLPPRSPAAWAGPARPAPPRAGRPRTPAPQRSPASSPCPPGGSPAPAHRAEPRSAADHARRRIPGAHASMPRRVRSIVPGTPRAPPLAPPRDRRGDPPPVPAQSPRAAPAPPPQRPADPARHAPRPRAAPPRPAPRPPAPRPAVPDRPDPAARRRAPASSHRPDGSSPSHTPFTSPNRRRPPTRRLRPRAPRCCRGPGSRPPRPLPGDERCRRSAAAPAPRRSPAPAPCTACPP
ncbi:hypothetical protein J4558_21800 [Leptolyngbya sp. 15MV]|nr:hypothetical protein J4558_21800 [Leptolyngbya sp. 15MV]